MHTYWIKVFVSLKKNHTDPRLWNINVVISLFIFLLKTSENICLCHKTKYTYIIGTNMICLQ